jgi:oligoribonuclease
MADYNERIWAAVVDLETTGLDAANHIPLELGIKLIDRTGFALSEAKWLICEPTQEWSISMMHGAADKFVGDMHEKSGLWNDLLEQRNSGNTVTREELDDELCEWLAEAGVEYGKVPMMGNSIGSLDRPFSIIHFPNFNKTLSYRNIDISTIKEICKAVNPELFENLRPIIGDKENAVHRVLEDIDACIVEYRAYCENFFFTEESWS